MFLYGALVEHSTFKKTIKAVRFGDLESFLRISASFA
jgi:hypothetical protein